MLRLWDSTISGNAYKIRLLLAQLGRSCERVEVDVFGDLPAELERKNLHGGRVPVLDLDDGRSIPESNAILWHLARDTAFLPADPLEQVRVLQWMFFEQNALEPNVGGARVWLTLLGRRAEERAEVVALWQAAGRGALDAMERQLAGHDWFVAGRYTIADIALFAYSHVAAEAGIDLTRYPAVGAWFARVRAQPGWIPLGGA